MDYGFKFNVAATIDEDEHEVGMHFSDSTGIDLDITKNGDNDFLEKNMHDMLQELIGQYMNQFTENQKESKELEELDKQIAELEARRAKLLGIDDEDDDYNEYDCDDCVNDKNMNDMLSSTFNRYNTLSGKDKKITTSTPLSGISIDDILNTSTGNAALDKSFEELMKKYFG